MGDFPSQGEMTKGYHVLNYNYPSYIPIRSSYRQIVEIHLKIQSSSKVYTQCHKPSPSNHQFCVYYIGQIPHYILSPDDVHVDHSVLMDMSVYLSVYIYNPSWWSCPIPNIVISHPHTPKHWSLKLIINTDHDIPIWLLVWTPLKNISQLGWLFNYSQYMEK